MKNEGDVKREVKRLLREHKAWYFMPVPTGYGVQGVPDFIVCLDGALLGIETKYGNNKPTAWQEKQMAGIEAAGGRCLVVSEKNLEELEQLLEVTQC